MSFQLEQLQRDLELEKQKERNLKEDLNGCQTLKDQLEENKFLIANLENERDFHHKNHTELRKRLFQNTQNEFNLKQLKRDNHFLQQELEALKARTKTQEGQVNELLVFAMKPRNEKQATSETFFAKQIVELQEQIKNQEEEIFQLKNFQDAKLRERQSEKQSQ